MINLNANDAEIEDGCVDDCFACPTCGENRMDYLNAMVEGQITCDRCETIYSDEVVRGTESPRWKHVRGVDLFASWGGNSRLIYVTIPGAESPVRTD